MSKCTGECCRSFALYIDGEHTTKIAAMRKAQFGPGNEIARDLFIKHGRSNFTCRAWDPNTRLCTIYDKRPELCRRYPSNGPCQHCGETDNGMPKES